MGRPLDQLYEQLKATDKIGFVSPKTYPRGVSAGYDPQAICANHSGSLGHSTINCWALKHKIQDMIDIEDIVLRRKDESGPNVSKNSLPEYKETVGIIATDDECEEPVQYIVDENEAIGIVENPFVLEEEQLKNNGEPFILDLPEPVVLEFPEQSRMHNLQEIP